MLLLWSELIAEQDSFSAAPYSVWSV